MGRMEEGHEPRMQVPPEAGRGKKRGLSWSLGEEGTPSVLAQED